VRLHKTDLVMIYHSRRGCVYVFRFGSGGTQLNNSGWKKEKLLLW